MAIVCIFVLEIFPYNQILQNMTYTYQKCNFDVTYEFLKVNGVEVRELPLMNALANLLGADPGVSYDEVYNNIDDFLYSINYPCL